MSTCASTRVPVHHIEALTEKVEAVHDRITERAYQRWLSRRIPGDTLVEFWAAADRELFCQPEPEIRGWAHGVLIQFPCAGVDPSTIRLFMSATELLLLAPLKDAGLDRWLFRYLRFEKPVDSLDASAQFENGKLCVSAACLHAPEEQKVNFKVA
jgi:hypothetical protein